MASSMLSSGYSRNVVDVVAPFGKRGDRHRREPQEGPGSLHLWLAVHRDGASVEEIAGCFEPYRPDGWTVDRSLENLDAKLTDRSFTTDLDALVADWPDGYSIESASRTVIELLELLR